MINNENFNRNFNRGFKVVICLWVLWALFCLSLVGGIIYVAVHFLSKVW